MNCDKCGSSHPVLDRRFCEETVAKKQRVAPPDGAYALKLSLIIDDPETVAEYKGIHADLTLEDLKDGTLLKMVSSISVELVAHTERAESHRPDHDAMNTP